MSEYDASKSPVRDCDAQLQCNTNNNDTLDEIATGTPDNSIIGKVKSRVSSIFPNSLSKWFSPTTAANNDSINGNSGTSRRRRREIEDDEEELNDEENAEEDDEDIGDEDIILRHQRGNDNSDDESNKSEDESSPISVTTTSRILNRQPPTKRLRPNFDITNIRDSPSMPRQSLVSSTPAVNSNNRSIIAHSPSTAIGRTSNRYTHLNLYGNQSKKEPPYNFNARYESNLTEDISRIPAVESDADNNITNSGDSCDRSGLSSRRSLNIPSTSHNARDRLSGLANLKRQSISTVKNEYSSTNRSTTAALPRRTSTTMQESRAIEEDNDYLRTIEEAEDEIPSGDLSRGAILPYNGGRSATNKRQKLINGSVDIEETVGAANATLRDSASESSECGAESRSENAASHVAGQQRKTGLFNMSSNNSRNGSRTSSIGNGLNFYSHLEGNKSLFSTSTQGRAANTLNNSTLSLTSLNRRQFNASIYGSTSALSDSRLLNTFSPFYKGKTTYGGAAAYSKTDSGGGAGASAIRITPTLIRPTSSLSTLSSSNNSVTAGGSHAIVGESSSAISSTAKRILDLINDFATPLSEAKKMANNLKTNQQQLPPMRSRLNESDLHSARAIRLSQVRTPYMRPIVTLKSTHADGKSGVLPPVRELQVPSMSQLLQMKKLQSSTERSRQITTKAVGQSNSIQLGTTSTEYQIPTEVDGGSYDDKKQQQQQQQQQHQQQSHTNKIKHKVTSSVRITASKEPASNESSPPPVNLPNVAFPLMKSLPKIDIALPTSQPSGASAAALSTSASAKNATTLKTVSNCNNTFAFNSVNSAMGQQTTSPKTPTVAKSFVSSSSPFTAPTAVATQPTMAIAAPKTNFQFSKPLEVNDVNTPVKNITPINSNYKFSTPILIHSKTTTPTPPMPHLVESPVQAVGQTLKSGSVLDALKKSPLTFSSSTSSSSVATHSTNANASFGIQFKKSNQEWECDTCLVRNKVDAIKCVACDTTRKTVPPASAAAAGPAISSSSFSFGSQFKKPANEWECDSCMLRNKMEASKCVACETPRRNAATTTTTSSSSFAPPLVKNSFGDAFKRKSNTWECPSCLITNKDVANECVACQTRRPGIGTSTSSVSKSGTAFKFGITNTAPTPTADEGFKALVAEQKSSKWECEACMTRNDGNRQKCICCEQAKPGTQTVSESVPKFSFGTSAASKYTFGFAPTPTTAPAPAPAIVATNSETTQKTETNPKGFVFGSVAPKQPSDEKTEKTNSNTGFTFGLKPVTSTAATNNDVVADSSSSSSSKLVNTTTATNSSIAKSDYVFGAPSQVIAKSTDVKFNVPATSISEAVSSNKTNTDVSPLNAKKFSFGSPTTAAIASTTTSVSAAPSSKPGGFAFSVPQTTTAITTSSGGGFNFKAPTSLTTPTTTSASSSTKAFGFGVPAASAAVKPMFSFGAASHSSTTTPAPASSTTAAPTTATTAATTTTAFGATAGASIAPSVTNVFSGGSFGSVTATPESATALGAAPKVSSATQPTSSTSTTSAFSGFSNIASNTKTFSFGGQSTNSSNSSSQSDPTKPIATALPLFGSASNSAAVPASNVGSAPNFMFGSPAATSTSGGNSSAVTSATTWPKNSFVFGGSAPANTNTNETVKSVFGTFGTATAAQSQMVNANANTTNNSSGTSIFGNSNATATTTTVPPPAAVTFGSASASNTSANIFGASSSLAPNNSNIAAANVFGGSASSGNAAAPAPAQQAPAFGSSSPFGSTNANATTFGSTATTAPTAFGGFGGGAASSSTVDGASAAKKSEVAFNFGATNTAPAAANMGGFNFGAAASVAAKPAFNFGSSNQPAFNFTGSAETQTAKPFQFGATSSTTSAPMFNFGGAAAVEASSNAPFQFSAGAAAPVSSNIFAPTPQPVGAQGVQQARRKIRAPLRRQTPR